MKKSTRIILISFLCLCVILYYFLDYKRHFIFDSDGNKGFTVWPRVGNTCYIIPGKYYSPFVPKTNFIRTRTHTNYIGVVWDTGDATNYKLSIYNEYEINSLQNGIVIYDKNELMLSDYHISLNSDSSNYLKHAISYEYLDLNRIWGIKRFKW